MMKKEINYQLYLVTEDSMPIGRLKETLEKAINGGVSLVQLREKQTEGKCFYERAQEIKEFLDAFSIPLIINDRVDIALAVEAAGVHIGQNDLPMQAVKKIIPPSMIAGVSARSVDEAVKAQEDGADYIGVGSIFPTSSKQDAKQLPSGMLQIIKEAVSIPVIAIGGINETNSGKLKKYNLDGVAVVSSITKADDPESAAQRLYKSLYE